MKSLCLSLSEVIKELDEIKLFFKIMYMLEKQVLSPLQWIWLYTSLHIAPMKQTTLHDYKINYFEDVSQKIIILQLLVYS